MTDFGTTCLTNDYSAVQASKSVPHCHFVVYLRHVIVHNDRKNQKISLRLTSMCQNDIFTL